MRRNTNRLQALRGSSQCTTIHACTLEAMRAQASPDLCSEFKWLIVFNTVFSYFKSSLADTLSASANFSIVARGFILSRVPKVFARKLFEFMLGACEKHKVQQNSVSPATTGVD